MVYNILKESIINIWPSLVIITVTLVVIRLAYIKHHKSQVYFYKEFWTLLAVIYMLLLYELVTRVDYNASGGVNIIPFAEIFRYSINNEMFIYNVCGNIALFIPFGYIISIYIKPKKIWSNLLIAIIVSATIETVQLNIGRSFDVDDILLNTIGCIIGYLVYVAFKAVGNHLPDFFASKWFNNLICLIILIAIIGYILNIVGIFVL